jgi:hypothetical protein
MSRNQRKVPRCPLLRNTFADTVPISGWKMVCFQCIIKHWACKTYGVGKKYSCVLNAGTVGSKVSLTPFPSTTSIFAGKEPMLAVGR